MALSSNAARGAIIGVMIGGNPLIRWLSRLDGTPATTTPQPFRCPSRPCSARVRGMDPSGPVARTGGHELRNWNVPSHSAHGSRPSTQRWETNRSAFSCLCCFSFMQGKSLKVCDTEFLSSKKTSHQGHSQKRRNPKNCPSYIFRSFKQNTPPKRKMRKKLAKPPKRKSVSPSWLS